MSIGLCKKKTSIMQQGALLHVVFVSMMFVQPVQAGPEGSFIILLNSLERVLAGEGLPDGDTGGVDLSAKEYWISDVDPIAQSQCKVCHQAGGTAVNSGARLLFTDSAEDNHLAMQSFVSSAGGSADLVLSKITGGAGHGGGTVISSGSTQYQAFEQYFVLLDGGTAVGVDDSGDFWEGLVMESPETTLRRASLLLAGKVASPNAIVRAEASEEALRGELIKLMRGDGFHDFLVTGAGDKLLTQGVLNGIDFPYDYTFRYPAWSEARAALGTSHPDGYDHSEKAFLHRNGASTEFAWAVAQEPLELIAYVVMNDKPYTEILTAPYTMVNMITDIAYRSEAGFEKPLVDSAGLYHPPDFGKFLPGVNRGHVPVDSAHRFDAEAQVVTSFSDYHSMPHAGVLTTPGWLGRYPSTETNRNRARARWTYFYFLGVDIEKSAKRSTDPDALADTNNPTMNNTACTVCHERLDPVAGAYQLFGDTGHYLDRGNGAHALPDTYTCSNCSDFQPGDTWFRDMRSPGFEGMSADSGDSPDSLQWLAEQIISDSRFPRATAEFWWPAIFGGNVLAPPESTDAVNYESLMSAYNAQQELIKELSDNFVTSGFNAKELLADMIMSAWYRASNFESENDTERGIALADIGSGRLLTPEELDRKNRAVFGRSWKQFKDGLGSESNRYKSALRFATRGSFNVFLGGINGANVTERNRRLTPLMSNVHQIMALDLACQIVLEEFEKPANDRFAFSQIEPNIDFSSAKGEDSIRQQLEAIFLRAYNRSPSEAQVGSVMTEMRAYASNESSRGDNFSSSGNCAFEEIWGSEVNDEVSQNALPDPSGMKRAWSMVVHSVLNSFWYLHD